MRSRSASSVQQFVDTRRGERWDAGSLNGEVPLVLGQVSPLRGFVRRHALLFQAADFTPHIAQVGLEVVDLGLVGERVAVTGKHGIEVELLQRIE